MHTFTTNVQPQEATTLPTLPITPTVNQHSKNSSQCNDASFFGVDSSQANLSRSLLTSDEISLETLPQLIFSDSFRNSFLQSISDPSDPSSQVSRAYACTEGTKNVVSMEDGLDESEKLSSQSDEKNKKIIGRDVSLLTDRLQLSQGSCVNASRFFNHPSIRIDVSDSTVLFFKDFLNTKKVWTLQEFMQSLDSMYKLTRVRFTKGGHKTNQDLKMRQSFICQCHGRGSHSRQAVFRKRDHYFSQSSCRARISIRQVIVEDPLDSSAVVPTSSNDRWVLDRCELQHNHEPQSVDFYLSQRKKEINETQRYFITECFDKNPKINGAEVRRHYSQQFPNEPDMFGKKVQNLIQILRQGKSITKGDEFTNVTSSPGRQKKSDATGRCLSGTVADHDSQCLDSYPGTQASSMPVKLDTAFNEASTAQSQIGCELSSLQRKSPCDSLKDVSSRNDTPKCAATKPSPVLGITFTEFQDKLTQALKQSRLQQQQIDNQSPTGQSGVLRKRDAKTLTKQPMSLATSPLPFFGLAPVVGMQSLLEKPVQQSSHIPQPTSLDSNLKRFKSCLTPQVQRSTIPELPRYLEDLVKNRLLASSLQPLQPRLFNQNTSKLNNNLLQSISVSWMESRGRLLSAQQSQLGQSL